MRIGLGVVCFFLAASGANSDPTLPAEIQQYYRDVNFISMFSTPVERLSIALKQPDKVDTLDPQRAKALSVAIASVQDHEIRQSPDPGMIFRFSNDQDLMFWALSLAVNLVEHIRQSDGGYTVQIRRLSVSEEDNLRLIAQYARLGASRDRDLAESVTLTGGTWSLGIQIHEWVSLDGKWMRRPLLQMLVP